MKEKVGSDPRKNCKQFKKIRLTGDFMLGS